MAAAKKIGQTEANPFALTHVEQLNRLSSANREGGWGLEKDLFDRLYESAPGWPEGRLAFRGLRIRFDSGAVGVAKTIEAHAGRIKSVFGEKSRRWDLPRSDKKHLRLLMAAKPTSRSSNGSSSTSIRTDDGTVSKAFAVRGQPGRRLAGQ